MNSNLNEMLATLTGFLKSEVNTETIIGKEFKLGEFSCIPVIAIGMGFGAGGGEGAPDGKSGGGAGGGAGAGVGMGPIGFLATHGDQIQFVPTRTSKGLSAVFEKVPGLIEKYLDKKDTAEKPNA